MPTRNISLTAEQDAFIEKAVKTGEYQNGSEAVGDALSDSTNARMRSNSRRFARRLKPVSMRWIVANTQKSRTPISSDISIAWQPLRRVIRLADNGGVLPPAAPAGGVVL